jgi:adenosylcobinamide-GDP ribazoletransferase
MSGLTTAIQTLSILPIHGKGCEDFAKSLPWFPLVGLLLGLILAGIAGCCSAVPAEAAAVLLLLAGVLLTRGFHMDGLADCADGFGGGYTRERVLEIMKDSSTGAFGAIAIALSLLIKWVALTHLVETGNIAVIIVAYVVSRALQVEQMVRLPYARATGTAASFVEGAIPAHRLIALITAGIVTFLLAGLTGLSYLALAWLTAFLFGLYCRKRVGGITGDLVGATSELTETLILFLPFFL